MDKQIDDSNINSIQMLTLILSENQCNKCIRLAREQGIQGGMVIIGSGTVSSAVLNLLGIRSQKKEIMHFLLKKDKAEEMLDYFDKELQLSTPGHGIAYTTPIINAVGFPIQKMDMEQNATISAQHTEGKCMFNKLTVIVDRGMSGDVMDIARKAGVRGGTILHGRGTGAEIATKLFGVEIDPEKELVIILTPTDVIDKVINELTQELHLDEPGKGVLFVEPILDTRGLLR